jgi:hypothetical protein
MAEQGQELEAEVARLRKMVRKLVSLLGVREQAWMRRHAVSRGSRIPRLSFNPPWDSELGIECNGNRWAFQYLLDEWIAAHYDLRDDMRKALQRQLRTIGYWEPMELPEAALPGATMAESRNARLISEAFAELHQCH